MLDIKRVLMSAKSHKREGMETLATPWTASLADGRVLPEHPRPHMVRGAWGSLNGHWDFAIAPAPVQGTLSEVAATRTVETACEPGSFTGSILVPFSPEAPASGVGRILQPGELLWYRRHVSTPAIGARERLIIHFEAVDWVCSVRLDGRCVAVHAGGYTPFDVDATKAARRAASDGFELAVCVCDPTDAGVQPRGKQKLEPGGIWYTPQSGIWQNVWYEVVPEAHLVSLTLNGTADGTLRAAAGIDGAATDLAIRVVDREGSTVIRKTLPVSGASLRGALTVEHPHLWSPDDPYLYTVEAVLVPQGDGIGHDAVRSYCAFRTAEVAPDSTGVPRFHLNGKPFFLKGALDQGYWPDGLMTAPADEALVRDIRAMRAAGFNMLRKHIKIECARWYYHCDRLGMLVWQDAVSGGGAYSPWHTSRKPTLCKGSWGRFDDRTDRHRTALSAGDEEYRRAWTQTCDAMVELLAGHPSIVTWVLFNEGWGQFDAREAARRVRMLDPTRPIDAVSGWYDQQCGDYLSHHNYFRPLTAERDRAGRAFVISEFGGWAQGIRDHMSSPYAYGYGNFPTLDAWRDAVHGTLAQARALEGQGLSGYVYTQVSDVEEELNGILTYDRRVDKLG